MFWRGLASGLALTALLWITGAGVAPNILERLDRQGINNWRAAQNALIQDAASRACTTETDLIAAAEARNWRTEPGRGYIPNHLQAAHTLLRIHVVPGVPFDKEPGDLFGFDARGCLLP